VGETITVRSGLELPLQKDSAEELPLRKEAASSKSEDKYIQAERVEIVTEHSKGTWEKEGTEELSSACQNVVTGDVTAITEGSSKVRESNVEGEVNRCRSRSIDFSDEETDFVKL
jgi:hypothetical protein